MVNSFNQAQSQIPLMNTAFIGIGANLNTPSVQVENAIALLSDLPSTQVIRSSSLYQTKPMGPQCQNDYINAVSQIETLLSPLNLLSKLQTIETQQGRVRTGSRWGPRVLDLDLLLFNNQVVKHPDLTIPHYGIKDRSFVLVPLLEISPKLCLPDGSSVKHLVSQIELKGIQKL